jgi:hypothetical protein
MTKQGRRNIDLVNNSPSDGQESGNSTGEKVRTIKVEFSRPTNDDKVQNRQVDLLHQRITVLKILAVRGIDKDREITDCYVRIDEILKDMTKSADSTDSHDPLSFETPT